MFTVRITEWVNGAPIERKRTEVNSKEEGMENLRALGHSWDLNPNHWLFAPMAGYLYEDETLIGRLDVHQHTYRVYEVGSVMKCPACGSGDVGDVSGPFEFVCNECGLYFDEPMKEDG